MRFALRLSMGGAAVLVRTAPKVALTAHGGGGRMGGCRGSSLGRVRYAEEIDAQVLADLKAYLGAVAQQILGAPDQGEPQQPDLWHDAVEVLIEEQQRRAQQGPVQILHFRLSHVCDLCGGSKEFQKRNTMTTNSDLPPTCW